MGGTVVVVAVGAVVLVVAAPPASGAVESVVDGTGAGSELEYVSRGLTRRTRPKNPAASRVTKMVLAGEYRTVSALTADSSCLLLYVVAKVPSLPNPGPRGPFLTGQR